MFYHAVFRGTVFQFHKGTIKTNTSFVPTPCNVNFNSIKVRLKQGFS